MIEVKNVTKKYGNFVAVDNISFTVNDGEVVGFLGPNGAGKSTTMNMITGFIEPTDGTIIVNGFDASKITSGTISEARLPNIPIEKLPAGALERMFVVESQTAAINAVKAGTIQEGDVVQIGNGGLMYFCIDDAATTFGNAFKEFTAGSATSVPWSGVTGKPSSFTPSAHNQASNTITALTGYAKSTNAAITTSDTLNTALGKLETKVDITYG